MLPRNAVAAISLLTHADSAVVLLSGARPAVAWRAGASSAVARLTGGCATVALLSIACASPAPPAPSPAPSVVAAPPAEPSASNAPSAPPTPSAAPAPTSSASETPPPAGDDLLLTSTISRFVTAANSDDDTDARAVSTPECWSRECSSFAGQAGRKFRAEVGAAPYVGGNHAAAGVNVICPGERKCDFAWLLLERTAGGWVVADVTESDAKAGAWIPH